jgi:DNA-binding NarL/FixJ family response regulator
MATRVMLVDNHRLFREGLRALLQRVPGVEVVGEAENGRAAVAQARQLAPDIVLMDIAMPDLNGSDATRQLLAATSGVKVIALSIHSESRYVTAMLSAGASGYLLKECAFEELGLAIETVAAGRVHLSPAIAGAVAQSYTRPANREAPSVFSALTPREREVLQLLAEGKSTREIAAALVVTIKTVETHRARIMKKVGTSSVAQLTRYALAEGLTSLDG